MPTQSVPPCDSASEKLTQRVEVTLAANVKAISPIVDCVMKLIRQAGCAAGKEQDVEIALREALANSIVHGCKNDPSEKVQCSVACEESGGVLLVVRDSGPGFDIAALPNPVHGESLYADRGRGIYLIRRLMDEVRFERGGTEVHMRKF